MKRATIKDISKMLGVNPSTVSRGLKNHPDISVELKEKIKQVSELLHYTPNLTAINLKSRQTKSIALIIPEISKFFIPQVINGISKILEQQGFKLIILISNDKLEKEIEHLKMCCYTQMDGIILSLSNQTKNLNHLQFVDEYEIPIVLFDKIIEQIKYSTVKINDKLAAIQCTNYLLKNKCKNLIGVFGNENLAISKARLKGFNDEIAKYKNIKAYTIFADNILSAKLQFLKIFKTNKNIDGVFCMSDEVLIGITAAMYELEIFNKIKLVSITDGDLIQFHNPPIPYIVDNGFEMGQQTATILLNEIINKSSIQSIVMATKFVE